MLSQALKVDDGPLPDSPQYTCVRIGGVGLRIAGNCFGPLMGPELRQFSSDLAEPEIEVSVKRRPSLRARHDTPAFDSGALWKLFCDPSNTVFDFTTSFLGRTPYKRMWVEQDYCRAHIELSDALLRSFKSVSPLEYPTDELLITNYLAFHGLGVEVHGCGVIDCENRGHLFLGHSGAGKSTTARLWDAFHDPTILSDDRIVLRLHDGELWMYGTPWHGEAAFAYPGKAKLNEIFILQHGAKNHFARLPKARAAGEVFARSFPPFHSAIGLERTIEFLARVVDRVPCFEFQFIPDRSCVDETLRFRGVQ